MLRKIINFILDTLFPIYCISCEKDNEWLCEDCLKKIPLKIEQYCPICEARITPDGRVCFSCSKKSPLDGMLVATTYKNNLVSKSVHYFKYRFIKDFSTPLEKIVRKSILSSDLPIPDIIIPVPLHKKRLRWRGFNQAELLANKLSSNLAPGIKIPLLNAIERKKYTSSQMNIENHKERKENIMNAFEPVKIFKKDIENKTIFLVDDISTTGATIIECAKILKIMNVKNIFAIVIARQEMGK